MARTRQDNPTPTEIEILNVIWERGPSTVREVMRELNKQRERAYTTIMTLMNGMADKGILSQKPQGRAFIYSANILTVSQNIYSIGNFQHLVHFMLNIYN